MDQVALDYIMGHIDQTMGGVYRQRIEDHRLEAVSEVIRSWLFSSVTGSSAEDATNVENETRDDKSHVSANCKDKPEKPV